MYSLNRYKVFFDTIYEYANNTLNELIKEVEQNENRLALAIIERFEERLEQSEQQISH